MKPSTRKAFLILILGVALTTLSFLFFKTAQRAPTYPPSAIQHFPEWTAATLIFSGLIAFAGASAFLSFALPPTGTLALGSVMLASFIVCFHIAMPFVNPHSWTILFALLSVIGCLLSLLVLLVGFIRWLKHRGAEDKTLTARK